MFGDRRDGKHGYLLFENPRLSNNIELIDGPKLGALLVETGSPVLVLNACRSAHNEALQTPAHVEHESTNQNPHLDVRAFGSFAQEVMDAGVPGVVAMRYNVYVVTAAQFVSDLYAALFRGCTLGEAVSLGRKQLHDNPMREVIYPPRALQDWIVPVVYEAAPLSLLPQSIDAGQIRIDIQSANALTRRGDDDLPHAPDVGFFGRDETLLAIDRAFDHQSIVLLHALAGSGKTSATAEFARWYAITGGAQKVIFTSFENHRPLVAVLDAFGRVFADVLDGQGIHWMALNDNQRREVALQLLKQVRVLWVWDNVEPVTRFPSGAASTYTQAEQQELLEFLRANRESGSKFLLTSRRDEYGWLGELAARISLPPMPMQERIQLAQAVAKKHGVRLLDIEAWRSLLSYTEGNPLTITVLTRQALQSNFSTKGQLDSFVAQLRVGEGELNDNAVEGRSNSLGASLSYGFASAFNKQELAQLALLHFFQGFVDINVFGLLRFPEFGGVTTLVGMTRDSCIALLRRAAHIGLLTAKSEQHYTIHPALPWYLKRIFDNEYADSSITNTGTTKLQATRGFVEAVGERGQYYGATYSSGNREVVQMLIAEEVNLLHAMRLALKNNWWEALNKVMLGLHTLYNYTGRKVEWSRVLSEAVPLFVDADSQGPLPGREAEWNSIMGYRVEIAIEAREFDKAESLLQPCLDWARRNTASIPRNGEIPLTDAHKEQLGILSKWLHFLGSVKYHKDDAACVQLFLQDYEICMLTQDSSGAAVTAQSLGHAYKDLGPIRNLIQAKDWYRRSLDLRSNDDGLGRALALYQLSLVSYEEFQEAEAVGLPWNVQVHHLNGSISDLQRAAKLVPANAVDALAVIHHHFGILYSHSDQPDLCLRQFQESIRYEELRGNHYGAAASQYAIAMNFMKMGRSDNALIFARAALRKLEDLGNADVDAVQRVQRLIQQINVQQSSA